MSRCQPTQYGSKPFHISLRKLHEQLTEFSRDNTFRLEYAIVGRNHEIWYDRIILVEATPTLVLTFRQLLITHICEVEELVLI